MRPGITLKPQDRFLADSSFAPRLQWRSIGDSPMGNDGRKSGDRTPQDGRRRKRSFLNRVAPPDCQQVRTVRSVKEERSGSRHAYCPKGAAHSEALPEASLGTRSGAPADPDGGCVSYWCSHALSLSGSALCTPHESIRTEFLEGISERLALSRTRGS